MVEEMKMAARFCMMLMMVMLCLGDDPLYKNPKQPIEVRIKDLLSRMTLDEKIGQMTQIERAVASREVIKQYAIGSVLNGGGSWPAPNASLSLWADMIDDFQNASLSTRLSIPMIYGVDAVHGHNNVYGATLFPHNIGLGATRDPDLLKKIGAATALEVRATGIPYAFAPCIAVSRDPRWGRCYESYGEDPALVKNMTSIILGLQGDVSTAHVPGVPHVGGPTKVAACAKHYVGDGGTNKGIDENNTITTYRLLRRIHLSPYFDALAKGVSTVMISYSSFNGIKMHANHFLVSKILKERMNFQGFVISDWEAIDRITDPPGSNYTYSVLASINAGLDMIMVPFDYVKFINILKQLVQSGFISQDRIDDAVTRILRVKFTLGLFEAPNSNRLLGNEVGSMSHRELAKEAVRKSLVLLKNGKSTKQMLPLDRNAPKILVAGSHADNLGFQCGGWTITWQGGSGRTTIGTTILEGIKKTVSKATEVVFEESPDRNFAKGKNFSYAIVVVGETPYTETAGDNMNLTIPLHGIRTIHNVCSAIECVVILVSGRPLVLQPHLGIIDAFVAAWLPGSEGQGVADVLFGDFDFQGKLSRTWFKTVDQLPMNVGDSYYDPLFPYGFGMTMWPHT